MSKESKPLPKFTRVQKIATQLDKVLIGMSAKNDIKLAAAKGDREAEQFCYGYETAVGEIQDLLRDLIPFD